MMVKPRLWIVDVHQAPWKGHQNVGQDLVSWVKSGFKEKTKMKKFNLKQDLLKIKNK